NKMPIINCDATTLWNEAIGCTSDAFRHGQLHALDAGLSPSKAPDAFAAAIAAFIQGVNADYQSAMLGMVADSITDSIIHAAEHIAEALEKISS
ncbi:hypothetical protein EB077_05145, partial [bacterium]|nr:hypothetical protein [bacterium]